MTLTPKAMAEADNLGSGEPMLPSKEYVIDPKDLAEVVKYLGERIGPDRIEEMTDYLSQKHRGMTEEPTEPPNYSSFIAKPTTPGRSKG